MRFGSGSGQREDLYYLDDLNHSELIQLLDSLLEELGLKAVKYTCEVSGESEVEVEKYTEGGDQ